MAPVNPTAAALLGFLQREPMTGWQVIKAAELELCDFWKLNRGQAYRELTKLAETGLIEAGDKGVREQVPYTITDTGRAAFREWLNEDPGPEITRSPLHLKLTFVEHLDEETRARFLRIHQRRTEESLDYYHSLEDWVARHRPNAVHLLRLAIMRREATLAWLKTVPWRRDTGESD